MKKNKRNFLIDPIDRAARNALNGMSCLTFDIAYCNGKHESKKTADKAHIADVTIFCKINYGMKFFQC